MDVNPKTDTGKQGLRNVAYGVVSAALAILVLTNVITEIEQGVFLQYVDGIFDLIGQCVVLATSIMAYLKSRPSRVTTVEVPAKDIVDVITR